jgi:hypothetical protein
MFTLISPTFNTARAFPNKFSVAVKAKEKNSSDKSIQNRNMRELLLTHYAIFKLNFSSPAHAKD